jgi:hypothetical protein
MMEAAERLEFEKAARLRDEINKLKSLPADARTRGASKGSGGRDSGERQPSKAGTPGTRAGRGRKRR